MATNRNRMYVALDEMTLAMEHASFRLTRATDKRLRLAGAVTIVLFLHACFLWVLINTHSDTWKIREMVEEDLPLPIELWTPPPPEPPVVPIEQPVPKPETEVQPQPQQQQAEPAPSPAPQAAAPQPVIQPAPTPAVVVPQDKPVPVVAPVATPQPVPAPAPALPNPKVKKKTDEAIQKKTAEQLGNASNLNLHQVQAVDAQGLPAVPSSGLTPQPSAQAPAAPGGRLGAMQNQGLPGGLSGVGLNGRGQLTQAMQNHDYCVAQQTAGKPIPANCNMPALTGMKSQGLKPDAGLQAAVAKKDANARYTQAAGNSDYWKRVNHVPTTSDRDDDLPKQGSYTGAKDQRVMGGGGKTADTGPQ